MENNIKSIQGWHESNCRTWGEYCKVGDVCSQDVYYYFRDTLPPAYDGILFHDGEEYSFKYDSKTGKYKNTYMTFKRVSENTWMYCGNNWCRGEYPQIE